MAIEQSKAESLANRLDEFMYNHDPYGYADVVEDREDGVRTILNDLLNGDTESYTNVLLEIRDDNSYIATEDMTEEIYNEEEELDNLINDLQKFEAEFEADIQRREREETLIETAFDLVNDMNITRDMIENEVSNRQRKNTNEAINVAFDGYSTEMLNRAISVIDEAQAEALEIIAEEEATREMFRQEAEAEISHGEENTTPNFVKKNTEAISKKDALLAQIKTGVRDIMTTDNYKAYLATRSRLFYRNFSLNNSIGIFVQKPNASYVNGFDQWKDYGRQVVKGAKAISILTPVIYHEKYTGGLYKAIVSNLSAQLDAKPNGTARYRVGMSPMELTMIKGTNSMGVLMNGREVAMLDTPKLQREFIDMNILNKIPAYFTTANVFDVSDTTVPEYLWIKESKCTKAEWALDDNGKPQRAKNGSIKIINTPERQAKFQPHLDLTVTEKDPETMRKLFDSLIAVSERNGVPVSVVERDSDKTLSGGADGYFHRPTEEQKVQFPRGYIVIPKEVVDNEPTKAVANLIHEMAHSDLHGNLDKLAERMGEEKIPRDMREVQAESVAYLVGQQYGIDTKTASFSYLANWSKEFDMQSFEKSLDVIGKEAQKLSSEIGAELDLRGLTQDLLRKPLEPLTEENTKAIAGQYVARSLEAQREITEQLALVPNLMQEHKESADILFIITQQKKNLDSQQAEVNSQIEIATKLENATDRTTQDKFIGELDSSFKRLEGLKQSLADEGESMVKLTQRKKVGLKEKYIANPTKTLNAMAKTYPQLAELSKLQLGYIAKSKFIERSFTDMLSKDPQGFVDAVTKRANDIMTISAKNGSFVEIDFCEQHTDKPIFREGDLCHPKVAESFMKDAETQIRGLKAEAEKAGSYFPYNKCHASVFTVSEKAKNLSVLNCRIDIGDGTQKGLSDYLLQESKSREVISHFDTATREKNAKEKIISYEPRSEVRENENKAIVEHEQERDNLEGWKEEIESERRSERNTQVKEENQSNDKDHSKLSKSERAD